MKKKELKSALESLNMLLKWKGIDINEISKEFNQSKNEKQDYELYLSVNNYKYIVIAYDENEEERMIGFISSGGQLKILSSETYLENYNKWVEKGSKVRKQEPVEWQSEIGSKAGRYVIDVFVLKNKNIKENLRYIYNLEYAQVYRNCGDDNIIKTKKTSTPVIF